VTSCTAHNKLQPQLCTHFVNWGPDSFVECNRAPGAEVSVIKRALDPRVGHCSYPLCRHHQATIVCCAAVCALIERMHMPAPEATGRKLVHLRCLDYLQEPAADGFCFRSLGLTLMLQQLHLSTSHSCSSYS
jgi:hypothetical protein